LRKEKKERRKKLMHKGLEVVLMPPQEKQPLDCPFNALVRNIRRSGLRGHSWVKKKKKVWQVDHLQQHYGDSALPGRTDGASLTSTKQRKVRRGCPVFLVFGGIWRA
jgi:hypothetical protein